MNKITKKVDVELQDFYKNLPRDKRNKFEKLAEYAIALGYRVKRDKVKHIAFTFISNRYKNGVMRFINDKEQVLLKLKFFGVDNYNANFEECLKTTIEEFNFKYTGCYGCGKCKGKKEGYIIKYPDNTRYFRCGSEYIDITNIDSIEFEEIKNIIKRQTDYYINRINTLEQVTKAKRDELTTPL